MTRPLDYMEKMSEALSEVMHDIGVNEKLVMKRRRSYNLIETLLKFQKPFKWTACTWFCFGSQIESSTTIGLDSDRDILVSADDVNVIQHVWEEKPGSKFSVMMIPNENISPSYCHLQAIRSDIPFPVSAKYIKQTKNNAMDQAIRSDTPFPVSAYYMKQTHAMDSEGRMLWMNNWPSDTKSLPENGPAMTVQTPGEVELDIVPAYFCKSSPLQAASWLQKLTESKWPSEDDKIFCRNAGCFLVYVNSKLSDMPKYEWRMSTSLQERRLMFSLNITQLRCYVLMKMILKTHIHPYVKDVLSSFMCKNVLMYCVYNSSHESSHDWHTGNLLSYLHLCLFMLKECVLQRNCPHLLIPGNNLLAGRMTDAQRGKLLDIIDKLMEDKEELLSKIQTDDLDSRLKMKLKLLASSPELPSATDIATQISGNLLITIVDTLSSYSSLVFLEQMYHENLELTQQKMSGLLSVLTQERAEGNSIQQCACDLLIPLVSSILGSVMACISIDAQTGITDEAFTYLEAGRESDVLSGRLKLVSVLYCTGDIERADHELKISQKQYKKSIVKSHCGCCRNKRKLKQKGLGHFKTCEDHNEEAIKFLVAFCTRFLNNEINCVPHELRYEILKSYIEEDRKMRPEEDSQWRNYYIAVDSVPYLYFLQYKTYGRLQRRTEQLEALSNLVKNFENQPDLNHKETTLNLIGQCFEKENRQAAAFQYYIRSLQQRERNNAARFLLCIQIFKLWKKYNL